MPADGWAGGDGYEAYVGRWSRLVAREVVARLQPAPHGRWLDVGCGTGAVTTALLAGAAPSRLLGIDPSPGFLRRAAATTPDLRAAYAVATAQALPLADAVCDGVLSGLVLNFVPDAAAAVREQVRVTRPGGTVCAYVWDYAGGMQLIRAFWDAAVEVDPAVAERDEFRRFQGWGPERLQGLWAGLGDVTTDEVVVTSSFADADAVWAPFLQGEGPAPAYTVSLPDPQRAEVRAALLRRLPVGADGTITLSARAWVVRGTA